MGGVKHGETHNIGLLIHYIIQSQQWEVLERRWRSREGVGRERQQIQMSDNVDNISNLDKILCKGECEKKKRGYWEWQIIIWRREKKGYRQLGKRENNDTGEREVDGNDSSSFSQKYTHKTQHLKYKSTSCTEGREGKKNQAHSIKRHINSNGRRGRKCIKEADENTGSERKVAGGRRKRAHHVCHHLHLRPPFSSIFLPSSSALPHLCTVLNVHFSDLSLSLSLSPSFISSLFFLSVTSLFSLYLLLSPP